MRIALVNDVPLAIEALRRFIRDKTTHSLAWTAEDGVQAVEKCTADPPDLILMDLIMPRMDGVEATRQIMRATPTAILIVTASVDRMTSKVFDALGAGALDAVNTPVLASSSNEESGGLAEKIQTIARLLGNLPAVTAKQNRPDPSGLTPSGIGVPLVAVGSSSGGPAALAAILSALPADYPACLAIVQHIDASFTKGLVDWLQSQTRLRVLEAADGDLPRAGTAFVAATTNHMVIGSAGCLSYQAEPLHSIHRPSINVFFESVASKWKGKGAGIILTGMGSDGAAGLLAMRSRRFPTLVQDRQSSAIYGMPKAAVECGAASKVLALRDLATELVALFGVKASRNH